MLTASAAHAGGFDRGGVNIDLLYSEKRVTSEVGVTHVMPQRTITNVQRGSNEAVAPAIQSGVAGQIGTLIGSNDPAVIGAFIANPANAGTVATVTAGVTAAVTSNPAFAPANSQSISVNSDFTVPRAGLKIGFTDDAACLGTYTEPFGADANYGTGNAYSASTVAFSIDTRDYGLTCSYRFAGPELGIGQSFFRVIGGISYQELEGFQSRQRFLDFANAGIPTVGGVTNTQVSARSTCPVMLSATALVQPSKFRRSPFAPS